MAVPYEHDVETHVANLCDSPLDSVNRVYRDTSVKF